jgi:uncharacterized protein YggE
MMLIPANRTPVNIHPIPEKLRLSMLGTFTFSAEGEVTVPPDFGVFELGIIKELVLAVVD